MAEGVTRFLISFAPPSVHKMIRELSHKSIPFLIHARGNQEENRRVEIGKANRKHLNFMAQFILYNIALLQKKQKSSRNHNFLDLIQRAFL